MVLIQIDDIKETFDEIDKMKENGWKCSEPTPLPTVKLTLILHFSISAAILFSQSSKGLSRMIKIS